ncbi:MAG: hypothetical protein LBD13_01440, partial [Spirochaetaceae bacterium]|nr:hypothetical protein [Spirochaetaceae bacterium]
FLDCKITFLDCKITFLDCKITFLDCKKTFLDCKKTYFAGKKTGFCTALCWYRMNLSALRASLGRIWGLFYRRLLFRVFFCELPVREQPPAAPKPPGSGFLRCAANACEFR